MRLGSRRSALAMAQAHLVAGLLGNCEIVPIVTSGDRGEGEQDKARWVIELEDALARGEIDLAVHSAKDLPGELADRLALLGSPARASAEDVLCGAPSLESLREGARVGTSSIRRRGQLLAARSDLEVVEVRGNVDTRLGKLADPEQGLDAIVLARAGLQRLGREAEAGGVLAGEVFVPAPGQGALALEGRADDIVMAAAVSAITDEDALACLLAERALARELGASCHTPLGAQASGGSAEAGGGRLLTLQAWIGLPDGSAWIADEHEGAYSDPEALGRAVAARLKSAGAEELLMRAETMAGIAGA
jgi:hydroxymethylbilane synthase